MSLSTKLNLMKLKSNSSHSHHHHHHHNHNHHSGSSSPVSSQSPISTSTSVPIFTFKNDPKCEDTAAVSMIATSSHFTEGCSSRSDLNESSLSSKPNSLSSSPSQASDLTASMNDKRTNFSANSAKKRNKNLGTYDSNEEDSPESSGDEYVHSGFVDEENKLIET